MMNSKDNKNPRIDARTFPQIWASIGSNYERSELRQKLMSSRCCSTSQTVWNWATGKTQPVEHLVLSKVAKVISDFLSSVSGEPVKCLPQTLFPAR